MGFDDGDSENRSMHSFAGLLGGEDLVSRFGGFRGAHGSDEIGEVVALI